MDNRNGTGTSGLLDHTGQPFRKNGFAEDGYGTFPLPHIFTYNQILESNDKAYFHDRWDEAVKHARDDALTMRRDAFLMGLLQERKLAVASTPWELEIPDEKDQVQRIVRDTLKRAIEDIADLRRIIYALLEATWYGRYAVEVEWDWIRIQGKRVFTVVDWIPINGDKLGWNFDGVPYVLVNPGKVTNQPGAEIINTTAGGRGLLLKGTWRSRFLIHRHEMDDGDYFDGESAAGVWGVGIRSRIFWLDWIRREYLNWITTFLERVGLGVTLWYYDGGNPAALQAVTTAAKNQSRRANLFVPIFSDGKGAPKGLVERVETPVNGVDALRMLKEDIETKIQRYIVGQEASSSGAGASGLGNQASAKFQMATKNYIANWDAMNLAETLTGNARHPGLVYLMQKWSFPETMPDKPGGFRVKFKFITEDQDSDKRLGAIEKVVSFGIKVRADDARKAANLTKPDVGDEVIELPQQPGMPGMPGAPPQPGAEGAEGGAPPTGAPDDQPPGITPAPNEGFEAPNPEPAEATPMQQSRVPFQYADDVATVAAAAPEAAPARAGAGNWNVYRGPFGGIGWRNALTGKIIYATSGKHPPAGAPKLDGNATGQRSPLSGRALVVRRHLQGMALARWYADHWNVLGELGLEASPSEKHEAGLELFGTGVSIRRRLSGDRRWHVLRHKEAVGDPLQYSKTEGAPAAPAPDTGGGAPTPLGEGAAEHVPARPAHEASAGEKANMNAQHTTRLQGMMGQGPTSVHAIKHTLHNVLGNEVIPRVGVQTEGGTVAAAGSESALRHGRQMWGAWKNHYGDAAVLRLQEMARSLERTKKLIASDHPNAGGLAGRVDEQAHGLTHALNLAHEQGMTPRVQPGHEGIKDEAAPNPAPQPTADQNIQRRSQETQQQRANIQPAREPISAKPDWIQTDDDRGYSQYFLQGMQNANFTPEQRDVMYGAHNTVLNQMSAAQRQNFYQEFRGWDVAASHQDLKTLFAREYAAYPDLVAQTRNGLLGGWYNPDKRRIAVDGNDPAYAKYEHLNLPAGVMAHEMGHSVDRHNTFSLTKAWNAAYMKEIHDGRLSNYAAWKNERTSQQNAEEGFAEFHRFLFSGAYDLAGVRQEFPMAWRFFETEGLLPAGADQLPPLAGPVYQQPDKPPRPKQWANPPAAGGVGKK